MLSEREAALASWPELQPHFALQPSEASLDRSAPTVEIADAGLAPLRVRGIEKVALHADLCILATLASALSRARAVPLAA